jgi:hypothetical protein
MTMTAAKTENTRARDGKLWDQRQDRQIYLVWIAINWVGMIAGFGHDFSRYLSQKPGPPLLIHIHAAVFVLWLVVQTAQIVLVVRGRFDLHRRLAIFALGLAFVMIPLGVATALTSKFRHLGLPGSSPQFLIINLIDIIPFGLFTLAGYLMRRDAASHKRLMMLAMVAISDPGFDRFSDVFLTRSLHVWPMFIYIFWGNLLLLALMTAWDLWRRRSLNTAFAVGAALLLASEFAAVILYLDPMWKQVATALVRAWGYAG